MDRVTLPDARWRHRAGLDLLADALGAAHGDARFVGGAVRDTLLGLDVSDIDIATRHAPTDVVDRLEAKRIKAIPTGIAHGTITAVSNGTVVEVTTLRRDVATDGRHATVAFTDDWREDAARRDFTMNALYADPATGEIFDYLAVSTISPRAVSASSAIPISASPKTISASCASSAFMPVS